VSFHYSQQEPAPALVQRLPTHTDTTVKIDNNEEDDNTIFVIQVRCKSAQNNCQTGYDCYLNKILTLEKTNFYQGHGPYLEPCSVAHFVPFHSAAMVTESG